MKTGRTESLHHGLRLAFWLPVLLWLAWLWGDDYARFFLPMFREVLDFALTDFRVIDFGIADTHEKVYRTTVLATKYLFINGKALPPGYTVDASTPMYISLIHPVVLGAAALAWPGLSWRGRLLRILLSLPFLLVLEALDVPLVLASSISDLLTFSLDPQGDRASRLVDWIHVMDGGGRIALAIAAAVGVAAVHGALRRATLRA